MTKYIIVKNSRKSKWPYEGSACDAAGVTPGLIYSSQELANTDAERLSKYNPIGFHSQAYFGKEDADI